MTTGFSFSLQKEAMTPAKSHQIENNAFCPRFLHSVHQNLLGIVTRSFPRITFNYSYKNLLNNLLDCCCGWTPTKIYLKNGVLAKKKLHFCWLFTSEISFFLACALTNACALFCALSKMQARAECQISRNIPYFWLHFAIISVYCV